MTTIEKDLQSKTDWIEMFPFGLVLGDRSSRPVMIFKDKGARKVLPVWLSPLDAGIAVSQNTVQDDMSPHELVMRLLGSLNLKLEKCLFRDVRGHQQFVELHFQGARKRKGPVIEIRADDVISFCLQSGCRFYSTIDFIERSRVLEVNKAAAGANAEPRLGPNTYLN